MFEKQKKLDSRVRFHQNKFRKQLQDARGYKRAARKPIRGIPTNDSDFQWRKFFIALGAVAVIGTIVYLLYIPNFLFISSIQVQGLSMDRDNEVSDKIFTLLKQKPFHAQQNIIFLSKQTVQAYLLTNNFDIFSVTKITKKLPHTLIVSVTPRVPAYLLTTDSGHYVISRDGLIEQDVGATPIATQTATSLMGITVHAADVPLLQQAYLPIEVLVGLQKLVPLLYSRFAIQVDHFEFLTPVDPNVRIFTKNGFIILLNIKDDIQTNVEQLQLILNDQSQQTKLKYIDLRFKNRAFVCLKTAPCTLEKPPAAAQTSTSTSSTPITIINP